MRWVLSVLGPLEVTGPKGPITLSWPRERTVLALLALNANRPVSVDRLVDAVWGELPPESARGQIQICVSRLRRSMACKGLDDRIVTQPPGYLLRAGTCEVDLQKFEELAEQGLESIKKCGPSEEAVAGLRQALGLFRGEPLTDVDSDIVRAMAVRLVERRMGVTEECIDAELRLGRHHEVLDELMELTAEHPLRTRLRALQMRALHQAGRQAEALATYQDVRRQLVEQLGIGPDAELRRLQMEILTDAEPGEEARAGEITAPRPVPRQLPPALTDFAGRTAEARSLAERLRPDGDGTPDGPPTVVSVSGKGGVGKTAFALQVAHHIADWFPDGHLYAELRDGDGRRVKPQRVLARFLRALGVPGSSVPETVEECVEMYRDRLAARQMLIVLDNVADEEQVLPLLPSSALCVVITTNRVRLGALPGDHRVHLDDLSPESAVELINRMTNRDRLAAEPSHTLELVRLCGGLPLALRIVAARLNARPHWTIQHLVTRLRDESRRLDGLIYQGQDVRATILVSYRNLTAVSRKLLRFLAMCGVTDFPSWIAPALLDCDPDAGAEVLDELVDVQLVDASRWADGTRYRMHDLVRVFALERLAEEDAYEERTAALRRVISAWLFLTDQAHLRQYGGQYTVIHSSTPRRRLPQSWVDLILANPLDWLDRERGNLLVAMAQAREVGEHAACWNLAMSMTTLFEARSYFDDWRESVDIALPAARTSGDRLGEAVMLYSRGTLELFQNHVDEAKASLLLAKQTFDEISERHGAALALRNLAWLDRVQGQLDSALAKYAEARGSLEEADDKVAVAHVLYNVGQIRLEQRELAEAQRCCEEALAIAGVTGSPRILAQVEVLLGTVYLELDEADRASEHLQQAQRLVRCARDQLGEAYVLHGLGQVHRRLKQYVEAEIALNQAYTFAQAGGDQLLVGRLELALGELDLRTGGLEEAAAHTGYAMNLFTQLGAERWQDRARQQLDDIGAQRAAT